MIKTKKLYHDFLRKYDRIQGKVKSSLGVVTIMSMLNEAYGIYFEKVAEMAEVDSKYRNLLRPLEVKGVELSLSNKNKHPLYESFKIPKGCYKILRTEVLAEKQGCSKKELTGIVTQSDDISLMRKSPFWKSSFEWEHVLYDEAGDNLFFWHEGDFDLTSVKIDYLKKPGELHDPSLSEGGFYIDWNGNRQTKTKNLELDTAFADRKIVDIAVLLAMTDIGDQRDYQLKLNQILQI